LAGAIGLLLVAGLLALAMPARANMDRPTWSVGNFWVYNVTSGTGPGQTSGTLRLDVAGTESAVVNGTSYSTYHLTASLVEGILTIPADIWFSTDTLAIVKISSAFDVVPGNASTRVSVSISGNPPQTIQWPLTTDATWTSATTVWAVTTFQGNTTYTQSLVSTTFTVQAEQTISVPAGSFTTTPIKELSANGTFTVNYWSASVGNWVRVGEYDGTGRNTGNFNLTSSNYAGPGFFGSVILGLPIWIWLILLVVIVVAIIGFFAVRRRKPPVVMPPTMPPQEPPMGP